MKLAVIGLGSMGKRRIRLLNQYIKEERKEASDWSIVGVDSREDRRTESENLFGIKTFASLDEALNECDSVVISTSPLSHNSIIYTCLEAGKNVFTELNLVPDGYEENIALAKNKNKVLCLSSTFLYRKDVEYVIDKTKAQKNPLNYTYHIGQYLPDWHPWEKVNEYFIGDKRTNGCREILAIELPWLQTAFGKIKSVQVLRSKNTALCINYDNNYLLLIEHDKDGKINKGTLAVDVMSRKPVRNLEVFNEDVYLSWNGTPDSLNDYDFENKKDRGVKLYENVDHTDGYASFVVENGYYNELKNYIEQIEGKIPSVSYGFEDDKETLAWIDKIEQSKGTF